MAEDPIRKAMWDEGLALLGPKSASFIGWLYKLSGGDAEAVLDEIRLTRERRARGLLNGDMKPFLSAAFQEKRV